MVSIIEGAKKAWNQFWPGEPDPNFEEKIVPAKQYELVAYKFERLDPAILRTCLEEDPVYLAVYSLAERSLDQTRLMQLQESREGSQHKQHQYLVLMIKEAKDKSTHGQLLLTLGGGLSLGLTAVGSELPKWAGTALDSMSPEKKTWVTEKLPFGVGGLVMSLTKAARQKQLSKSIDAYGPAFAQMPTHYVTVTGAVKDSWQHTFSALSQTWKDSGDVFSQKGHNEQEFQNAANRIVSSFNDMINQMSQKVYNFN